MQKNKNIITLHDGGLKFSEFKVLRDVQVSVLKSAKYVIALNEEQRKIFMSLNPGATNVVKMSSYIRPLEIVKNEEPMYDVFVSGYPIEIYNFDLVIDFAKKNNDLKFCFVIYGAESSDIGEKLSNISNVNVIYNVNPDEFLELIAKSKVLLRPTTTDSVGIAVCDAAYFGVKVVATNCCERPDGSIILDRNDLNVTSINKAVRVALSSSVSPAKEKLIEHFDSSKAIKELYDSLY